MFRRADWGTILKAAGTLADTLRPKKIILFGSYAYGKPGKDSDVDFMIVVQDRRPVRRLAIQASEALFPRPFPMDIVVRTQSYIRRSLRDFDPFLEDVLKKGKVLYEE